MQPRYRGLPWCLQVLQQVPNHKDKSVLATMHPYGMHPSCKPICYEKSYLARPAQAYLVQCFAATYDVAQHRPPLCCYDSLRHTQHSLLCQLIGQCLCPYLLHLTSL